jgi:hypothetical protein
MQARPTTLGRELSLETQADVDAALQEMAWLTAQQKTIEASAQTRIESIKTETQAKLVVEVAGEALKIQERWDALQLAVLKWCETELRSALPPNKKSLKLSHGEIKLRAIQAAVEVLEGKKADDVAFDLARRAEILAKVDRLLQVEVDGIPLSSLVAVTFVLAKDAIKEAWVKRPDIRETLQSLAISVKEGTEQITLVPAAIQVATTEG